MREGKILKAILTYLVMLTALNNMSDINNVTLPSYLSSSVVLKVWGAPPGGRAEEILKGGARGV
jgi:hypothetical protein